MNQIFTILKLYALSFIFATGSYFAVAARERMWIVDELYKAQRDMTPALVHVVLNVLSDIGALSFAFFILFGFIGILINHKNRGVAKPDNSGMSVQQTADVSQA